MIAGKYLLVGGDGAGDGDFGVIADEAIALTGKAEPVFLYVGFAQLEPHHGFEYYGALFAEKGARCSVLTQNDVDDGSCAEKALAADVIFIMGGNTGKLMRALRGAGLDETLREAARRGTVLCGFSAGAICLCGAGISKNEDYLVEEGIGCLDFLFCPHPMRKSGRFDLFKSELKNRGGRGLASDGAAIEIVGGRYRAAVFCPSGCTAQVCEYAGGEFTGRDVPREWTDLPR